ncbi:methyltransferase domain-containing protein [Candidatus Woesearchaeota archaeon]|nr:methyltransferase domain-containing protein [Candidatus Woesearchaeota archaeon]
MTEILNFESHPIAHHLMPDISKKEPSYPFSLFFCNSCGLIQIAQPIPAEIFYSNYHFFTSWKDQPQIPIIINEMESMLDSPRQKKILDVGCNDGVFLDALKKHGYDSILGIEPSRDVYNECVKKGLPCINEFFTKNSALNIVSEHGRFDVVAIRHVLEHIQDLGDFMEAISLVLAPNGVVIIEVPDFYYNLKSLDYTAWEEHVNYFTSETLSHLLSLSGIHTVKSESVLFSGSVMIFFGSKCSGLPEISPSSYMDKLAPLAMGYGAFWPKFRDRVSSHIAGLKGEGKNIAAYGAGARLSSFINFFGIGRYLSFVADDQVEKQGKFMPGSLLPIVPSDELEKSRINVCLLGVNSENEGKVMSRHKNFIQNGGVFYSVLPPSVMLLPVWAKAIGEYGGGEIQHPPSQPPNCRSPP